MKDRKWKSWQLALRLMRHPFSKVLLHGREVIPPSPWTDEFSIVLSETKGYIILDGSLT